MVDFIIALGQVLPQWPENTKWSLSQIAQYTHTALPQALEYMSFGLDRSLDVHEPLSYKEAERCLNNLRQRMQAELNARQRQEEDLRRRAAAAFDQAMQKVRDLQSGKNWHSAYRTLSYFLGSNEKYLSAETTITACNECLRLGAKAGLNLQELGIWLRKCVDVLLAKPSTENIEDALDIIETYGEHFLKTSPNSGQAFLNKMISAITLPALEFQATTKLNEVCVSLNIPFEVPAAPTLG